VSYSLNQLLDATGINELTGSHLKKTASERESFDFSKLAQRCRDAAETPVGEIDPSAHAELVEKTAAVAVIHKTLSEIRHLESSGGSVKTAAAQGLPPAAAAFIKSALAEGHSPEQIAKFLQNRD
jgi:hypothetical protein